MSDGRGGGGTTTGWVMISASTELQGCSRWSLVPGRVCGAFQISKPLSECLPYNQTLIGIAGSRSPNHVLHNLHRVTSILRTDPRSPMACASGLPVSAQRPSPWPYLSPRLHSVAWLLISGLIESAGRPHCLYSKWPAGPWNHVQQFSSGHGAEGARSPGWAQL